MESASWHNYTNNMYKEAIEYADMEFELELQGDPNDRINKELTDRINKVGSGRFSMEEIKAETRAALASYEPTDEEKIEAWHKQQDITINRYAGNRKTKGTSILRNLRNGVPISEQSKNSAVLCVGKDQYILAKHAKHQDINDAREYWEVGRKQTAVRDEHNREDYAYVLSQQFTFLGDLM